MAVFVNVQIANSFHVLPGSLLLQWEEAPSFVPFPYFFGIMIQM
jgi:hypothetical protein